MRWFWVEPPRLTAAQKDEALRELLDHLDHHRRVVRAHFRDLHAAARRAFPLDEVLDVPAKGKP